MTEKEQWVLWSCKCGSTMKINRIASEEEFNRFKDCICDGGQLEYQKDLDGEDQ
ncbi:hypothetical protein KP806_07405 [Paenibacillus sp. N4]|uniref:hypothetical protein n=1 Tax=Paenibacillus vietnamensis TaxID=2590547 RepID=UPI001CD18ACB|nr:hypothetical protein [Paenibacillus vietnamensis]MCA0754872.1 hypothetical protein [Paenibacillus vietnamensis]